MAANIALTNWQNTTGQYIDSLLHRVLHQKNLSLQVRGAFGWISPRLTRDYYLSWVTHIADCGLHDHDAKRHS
jgi:hypothetical protein